MFSPNLRSYIFMYSEELAINWLCYRILNQVRHSFEIDTTYRPAKFVWKRASRWKMLGLYLYTHNRSQILQYNKYTE